MSNFAVSVEEVLKHEGGYVNHPHDPGGETIYGISRRSHPAAWLGGRPSMEDAKVIYRNDYWLPIKADALPLAVALIVFDTAVNAGPHRAVVLLQRALRVGDDGIVGPLTLAAANRADTKALVSEIATQRILFNASLPTFKQFGLGWTRRCVAIAVTATALIK